MMRPTISPHGIQIDRLAYDSAPSFFMEHIVDRTFGATFDWPHRHDFQEILWVQAGRGVHSVDGISATLTPHTLAVIVKGQVHNFLEAHGFTAYVFRFTDDFLYATASSESDHATLIRALRGQRGLHVPASEAAEFDALCTLLAGETVQAGAFGKTAVLRHLLHALLIKIERLNRLASAAGEVETAAGYTLYHAFIVLLEQHYTLHHDVRFYADGLAVSPARLSRLLQQVTGRPAKRLILERVQLEAQRLLQFTPLAVKEIADALGYTDPFHFSKVFKQEIGLTPQGYRDERQKLR